VAYVAVVVSLVLGLVVLAATALSRGALLVVAVRIAAMVNLASAIVSLLAVVAVWATGNDELFGKLLVPSLAMCVPTFGLWRLLIWRGRRLAAKGEDAVA